MSKSNLTQKRLKELLHYNHETGIFTWLVSLNTSIKVGTIAGTIDRTQGYERIGIYGKQYKSHHLVWLYMYGEWPKQMDHINHIRNDNRWCNLREATYATNAKNKSMRITNTSGHNGVYWDRATDKWRSNIRVDGVNKYLGRFITLFAAVYARHVANIKFGFHPNHGKSLDDIKRGKDA